MTAQGSAQQDAKVSAAIGAYEELPVLSLEKRLEPMRWAPKGSGRPVPTVLSSGEMSGRFG
jgi:hypothetical protein